jgi:hypothetical protein
VPATRDWDAEIDRWTAIFATVADPPEPFATALREGWTPERRAALAAEAQEYLTRYDAYLGELIASGVDLVRLDAKMGDCGECRRYVGKAYSLTGASGDLPAPPPLPICPACRHTLNMLTPFFLQSTGLDLDALAAEAEPYVPPEERAGD